MKLVIREIAELRKKCDQTARSLSLGLSDKDVEIQELRKKNEELLGQYAERSDAFKSREADLSEANQTLETEITSLMNAQIEQNHKYQEQQDKLASDAKAKETKLQSEIVELGKRIEINSHVESELRKNQDANQTKIQSQDLKIAELQGQINALLLSSKVPTTPGVSNHVTEEPTTIAEFSSSSLLGKPSTTQPMANDSDVLTHPTSHPISQPTPHLANVEPIAPTTMPMETPASSNAINVHPTSEQTPGTLTWGMAYPPPPIAMATTSLAATATSSPTPLGYPSVRPLTPFNPLLMNGVPNYPPPQLTNVTTTIPTTYSRFTPRSGTQNYRMNFKDCMPSKFFGTPPNNDPVAHVASFKDYCYFQNVQDEADKMERFKISLGGSPRLWIDTITPTSFQDMAEKFMQQYGNMKTFQSTWAQYRAIKWDEKDELESYRQTLAKLAQGLGTLYEKDATGKYTGNISNDFKMQFYQGLPLSIGQPWKI